MGTLESLVFDNVSLRALPTEPLGPDAHTSRTVRGFCYSRCHPVPLNDPVLVCASQECLALLGLATSEAPRLAPYVGCQAVLPGCEPAAHCYAGHQFGHFSGQLGDGAAMYLGEVVSPGGDRWEVQLKGAGPTPYSRNGDGRKVLRSSMREFLASEAMDGLGIPTTRAAAIVTSSSRVARDPFYDGCVRQEPCAVVMRVAGTFLRFGSLEVCKPIDSTTGRAGPSAGLELSMLPKLLDFVVAHHYPHLWQDMAGRAGLGAAAPGQPGSESLDSLAMAPVELKKEMYGDMLRELAARTGRLVAQWDTVGFCHGVLNTDNMSVTGLTLDYGPFAFLNYYDPDFVSSGSDDTGRYAFGRQRERCAFNLSQLAVAVQPITGTLSLATIFTEEFLRQRHALFLRKLGLLDADVAKASRADDEKLIADLLKCMKETGADYTFTFRALCDLAMPGTDAAESARAAEGSAGSIGGGKKDGEPRGRGESGPGGPSGTDPALSAWAGSFVAGVVARCLPAEELRRRRAPRAPLAQVQLLAQLVQRDPTLLHMVGLTREQVEDDMRRAEAAEAMPRRTAEEQAEWCGGKWMAWLGQYRARLAKEVSVGTGEDARRRAMQGSNPAVVPRNWVLQHAIECAERGEFGVVDKLLRAFRDPYSDAAAAVELDLGDGEVVRLDAAPPARFRDLRLTCSS